MDLSTTPYIVLNNSLIVGTNTMTMFLECISSGEDIGETKPTILL